MVELKPYVGHTETVRGHAEESNPGRNTQFLFKKIRKFKITMYIINFTALS